MRAPQVDRQDGVAELRDGGEIAYQVCGRDRGGPPVLLIRPLGGSMALWGTFRDRLSEDLRVVSFDLRGTGRSSRDRAGVSTRSLARDGLHVLDHLGVARAHVFGISLGGMAATWLAILAPARVVKLCLASTPARGLELTPVSLRCGLALAACFAGPADEVEPRLVRLTLSRRFRETHPEQVRGIERRLRAGPTSRAALLEHALAGALHDARRELCHVHAETLVLAGERDTLLGTRAPRALSRRIPRSTFAVVADSGHDLTLEQPLVTGRHVSTFFMS
jgi:3-oxoadipate enol-lactonase